MSRYIDADALIEYLKKMWSKWDEEDWYEAQAKDAMKDDIDIVNKQPTVDAVQVVRCANCKWWWKAKGLCAHPNHCHDNLCVHECGKDYFCADGERKDDAEK